MPSCAHGEQEWPNAPACRYKPTGNGSRKLGLMRRTLVPMASKVAIAPIATQTPIRLFIPPSVLSSCVIGFVLPAGLGHPIGASRSQRSGGGTVGWGSWIPCSNTRCECGWRLSLPKGCGPAPCDRANASGPGGIPSVIPLQGLWGLSPAGRRRAARRCRRRGCRLRTPASLTTPMQNPPDAPVRTARPAPLPLRALPCACRKFTL